MVDVIISKIPKTLGYVIISISKVKPTIETTASTAAATIFIALELSTNKKITSPVFSQTMSY